ncbi:predicted protein [Nematostella vectensis]|uniref:Uncharacterized protein n=1 Tax=Nematostella vectensis TaxID=45351 RepID=A7SM74_NEMVE|nr:predicted protein [Nematostella vectensis]|eukprot:XP_001627283.1 predicted protein [Nematostella vectensis]
MSWNCLLQKGAKFDPAPVRNIPRVNELKLLGITLQTNSKFSSHINITLKKANACLYVIRSLRKEGYQQAEVNHLFTSIAVPKLTYGLAVYGASRSELNTIKRFLDNCKKGDRLKFENGYGIHEKYLALSDGKIGKPIPHIFEKRQWPTRKHFNLLTPLATGHDTKKLM